MKLQVLLSVLTLAAAFPQDYPSYSYKPKYKDPSYQDEYYSDEPKYAFEYEVKDDYYATDFRHQESRDGDYTNGQYQVLLPNGQLQTVTYTADEYGYQADVQYVGEPKYDYKYPSSKYDGYPKYLRNEYEPSYPKPVRSPYEPSAYPPEYDAKPKSYKPAYKKY